MTEPHRKGLCGWDRDLPLHLWQVGFAALRLMEIKKIKMDGGDISWTWKTKYRFFSLDTDGVSDVQQKNSKQEMQLHELASMVERLETGRQKLLGEVRKLLWTGRSAITFDLCNDSNVCLGFGRVSSLFCMVKPLFHDTPLSQNTTSKLTYYSDKHSKSTEFCEIHFFFYNPDFFIIWSALLFDLQALYLLSCQFSLRQSLQVRRISGTDPTFKSWRFFYSVCWHSALCVLFLLPDWCAVCRDRETFRGEC